MTNSGGDQQSPAEFLCNKTQLALMAKCVEIQSRRDEIEEERADMESNGRYERTELKAILDGEPHAVPRKPLYDRRLKVLIAWLIEKSKLQYQKY